MFLSRIPWQIFTVAILLFLFSLGGCIAPSGHIGVDLGENPEHESQPPPVEKPHKKDKKNGPPQHAPAHGYRAKHMYRYYPEEAVYHDTDRGVYFYIDGGNWTMSVSLPGTIRLGTRYVSLEIDGDEPYLENDEHKKKYPPGKAKKKNKKNK